MIISLSVMVFVITLFTILKVSPTPSARTTPTGGPIPNGMPTFIVLSQDPSIDIWEKIVQPPGFDGGEALDITNMFNLLFRTKAPQFLMDVPDIECNVQYHTKSLKDISIYINTPQTITIIMPDHGTIAFYGYVRTFIPEPLEEKKIPMAKMGIVCTNYDPVNCLEETPVWTAGSTCYAG